VLGISFLPFSLIFLLDFGTVLTVWYFLFFILLLKKKISKRYLVQGI
jgi:hypothetical protein